MAEDKPGTDMRAISPLVATAILLIITVAGGVMLYNYMFNTLSAPQDYSNLAVSSASMLVSGDTIYLNVKATNVGTRDATVTAIVLLPENITISTNQVIGSGETKGFTVIYKVNNTTIDITKSHYIILKYDDQETEPIKVKIIK